ncbi:uncharacterized protein [Venturia canescens]|uniref:uncharacterized protein isoform X3 n=1 Tax=Venturia canescens TaxID=32260 RepID=UPI001C9BE86C|nr:uncharacterized protein LOC122408276 isoform X3 [Venturia canescens]
MEVVQANRILIFHCCNLYFSNTTNKLMQICKLRVGTSIIFIAFSNQRPSIQTLVTETHKHLRNFQENLKDVEEKRLVTDSKYLALLGLDGQAGTTTAPSKAQNVTVVTLLRPGSEQHIYGFLRNITHYLPNNNIAVFGVGLSDYASQTTALNTLGNILYMDSNVRLNSSDVVKYLSPKSGVLTWPTKHAISSLTHPKMYEYFHVPAESFFFLPFVRASHIVLRNTREIRNNVMLPWVQCALTRDCICPIGAQSAGCRFNKRPQYRYSGCHAYDTSALNIILGLYFNYDDSCYVHQERETYFTKIQSDEVTEEYLMIARQNNATESNVKTLMSMER